MKKSIITVFFLALSLIAQAVDVNISGKVTDTDNKALSGATVALEKSKLSTKTDDKGNFSIVFKAEVGVTRNYLELSSGFAASLNNKHLSIHVSEQSVVIVTGYSHNGSVLFTQPNYLNAGTHLLPVPLTNTGIYLYRITSGNRKIVLQEYSMGKNARETSHAMSATSALAKQAKGSAAFSDKLTVTKSGYQDFSMNIDTAEKSGISIQLKIKQSKGPILPQSGNPVQVTFDGYKKNLKNADNILSFQQDCGGWPKNVNYGKQGKGGDDRGTFDNGATIMEITVMAHAYKQNKDQKYLTAARKGMDFVLTSQYPEGGWPQFYPLKGGYADHVTFNDEAMSRVLTMLQQAADKNDPFDTDVFTDEQRSKFQKAIDGGVDYILKAQIMQNGKKTAWCAQHGKSDYKPKRGRAYEHPSISGSESIGVTGFLLTQPQTPEIKAAILAAIDWFRSPDTYMIRGGKKTWFRFYDIATNKPIFSNYDGVIWIGIEHEGKKKGGYSWSGGYGNKIIAYAEKVGF